jgi:hypothetical protein
MTQSRHITNSPDALGFNVDLPVATSLSAASAFAIVKAVLGAKRHQRLRAARV